MFPVGIAAGEAKIALKNALLEGDKDIRYKTVNFMKEIWDSMKPGRIRSR